MMYACGVSQNSKIPFCHVIESIVMFSFYWCGACRQWWSSLLLIDLFFCLLSSLKNYSLRILVVDILTLFSIFFISHFLLWFFCRSFICFSFILEYQFTKYYILQFGPQSLDLICFPWSFCKKFINFQFHHSVQINGIMFSNLILIILILIFFLGPFVL
jgi:hypothetical protein